MSFQYHKNKGHSEDSFWTSYSDLFLGLSTIFLLLYVTSSLRTGTDAIRNQIENESLTMKVSELQQQLAMYESVKDDYLKKAEKSEVQEYQELMDKLTLLQEEAKTEKEKLLQQARENSDKVQALNKYQQMVRNVLNANKMAKSKIENRDDLIKEQDVEIEQKQQQIVGLQTDIQNKTQLIYQGQRQIQQTQAQLAQRTKDLQNQFKRNKLSKKKYEAQMAQLKAESESKVQQLASVNSQYQNQISQAQQQISQYQGELSKTQGMLAQKEEEATQLAGTLTKTKAQAAQAIAGLEAGLATEKKKGAQRVAELENQFKSQQAALKGAHAAEQASLRGALQATKGELEKAKAEIEARKSVAKEIQAGFAKAGVKADIDLETGDVVLDFGQTYFDSNSDKLKTQMKDVLEKAMPVYSKSLFGNPTVAPKVSAVEIIGFASPTYQGRYIDPYSSKPEDKAAIKYNMDLSYRRANSIFGYLLDDGNLKFKHQKDLLGKIKVSGRSFLEVMDVKKRNVSSAAEFCKQNDCKKAQRVIIRFNMDQKK